MYALTLTAPWASAIAAAAQHPELGKRIETRGWALPPAHIGRPLAIHQAAGLPRWFSEQDLIATCALPHFRAALAAVGITAPAQLPRGAIVAIVTPVVSYQVDQDGLLRDADGRILWVSDQEHALGNYDVGRFAWPLDQIRALAQPVPCRGAQRLWRVPPQVEAAVRAQPESSASFAAERAAAGGGR